MNKLFVLYTWLLIRKIVELINLLNIKDTVTTLKITNFKHYMVLCISKVLLTKVLLMYINYLTLQ